MIRLEPLEKSLPKEWRRTVRDHPLLSLAGAAAVGVYVGRHHGPQLLAALVSTGLAFGADRLRGMLGVSSARSPR